MRRAITVTGEVDMAIDDGGISGVSGLSGMASSGSTQSAADKLTAKKEFGAAVVKTTLDYMNSGSGSKNSDYDFQTKVLEGGAVAKGMMISGKA